MSKEEAKALLLPSEESDDPSQDEAIQSPKVASRIKRLSHSILSRIAICLFVILLGTATLLIYQSLSVEGNRDKPEKTSCSSPPIRYEWRALSDEQKNEYIKAVQCLRSTPSVLSLPQSLYDDFPYIHMHVGNITHDTAGFLPWHRYFVFLYETALRTKCNYSGHMPYWDWTRDWADFRNAPVWNPDTGFGGDGGVDAPRSVGEGRCVVDGPFAGLEALYSNMRRRPHCLSRGFPHDKELARWTEKFKPEEVARVMALQDYQDFYLTLENGPHLAIPYSVRGDFYRFTAPYDPVFFLHHTQLDRLWWEWQRTNISSKVFWSGAAWDGTDGTANMDALLDVSALGTALAAVDVMSTTGGFLCYQY